MTSNKTWTESERQGAGRRYWFDTEVAAELFATSRECLFFVSRDGRTVWVSNARRARAITSRSNNTKARRVTLVRVRETLIGKDDVSTSGATIQYLADATTREGLKYFDK